MAALKKFIKWFFIVILVLVVSIFLGGKTYLFKAVANTYLKGKSGPSIDEYKIFSNREIETATPQNWPSARDYNQHKLTTEQRNDIENYKTVAFLVLKNDSVKYEEYWDGFGENSITNSFSMAKSIVSILIGIA